MLTRRDFDFWPAWLGQLSWGKGSSRGRTAAWQLNPDGLSKSGPEDILRWIASMDTDMALAQVLSSNDGISDDEAKVRLELHGENIVSSSKPQSWFMLLLSVIPNPFNILLVFLAILNVAIPNPSWVSLTFIYLFLLPQDSY